MALSGSRFGTIARKTSNQALSTLPIYIAPLKANNSEMRQLLYSLYR